MKHVMYSRYVLHIACLLILLVCPNSGRAQEEAPPVVSRDVSKKWDSTLHFGLDFYQGNSDVVKVNVGAKGEKIKKTEETKLKADFYYGESEDEKNVENALAVAEYNWLYTEQAYLNMKAEYSYDNIAGVDYRVIVGPPSLGFYLYREDTRSFAVEGGFAWLWEKVDEGRRDAPVMRLKEEIRHSFNDHVKGWESVEYLPELDAFGNFLLKSEVGMESALTKWLSFRLQVKDTYDSEPSDDLEKNDISLHSSLVFKF